MSDAFDFHQPFAADAPTDPGMVLGEIASDCRSLDAVGKALGAKLKDLAEAEIEHSDAFDAALVTADASSKEKREAQARMAIDPELRGRLARLTREVEALNKYARIKGDTLSGRQSQLSTLRDEQRGQQGAQPQWTPRESSVGYQPPRAA